MESYKQTPMEINCPVCFAGASRLLWNTGSRQAAQHYILQEKYPERFTDLVAHIERLWGKNTCEVVRCDACGFCYSVPFVAGDARFYELAYLRSGYPVWKWEFQVTLNALKDSARPGMKLMEIGAGDGAFVRQVAEKLLLRENILCTEYSAFGKRQIEKLGIQCLSEDVRNLSQPGMKSSMDFICMFQVLEHMDGLDDLFQKLNWLLKADGSLFIAVPNSERIAFNELNGALLDMPPNHIGRWNKKCFIEIGMRNGFSIAGHEIEKFGFFSALKQFTNYRLLKRSQKAGSFENLLFRPRNRFFLRVMQVLGLTIHLIPAAIVLVKTKPRTGDSQWVHLTKVEP